MMNNKQLRLAMIAVFCLIIVIVLIGIGSGGFSSNNPLNGTWVWSQSNENGFEHYRFRGRNFERSYQFGANQSFGAMGRTTTGTFRVRGDMIEFTGDNGNEWVRTFSFGRTGDTISIDGRVFNRQN